MLLFLIFVLIIAFMLSGCANSNNEGPIEEEIVYATSDEVEEDIQPTQLPKPEPISSVVIELTGKINTDGMLLQDLNVNSADEKAILRIAKGTSLRSEDNTIPTSLSVVGVPAEEFFQYGIVSGLVYEFSPENIILDRPAELKLLLVPLPADITSITPDEPEISRNFPGKKEAWTRFSCDFQIDWQERSIRVDIDKFGKYAVTYWYWYVPPRS